MNLNAASEERNIATALISGLGNMAETPTREDVEEKARQLAGIFGYAGDLRNIITEAMISVDTMTGTVENIGQAQKFLAQKSTSDRSWTRRGNFADKLY